MSESPKIGQMRHLLLWLACAAAYRRADEIRRIRQATNGTRILAPCWGRGKGGEQLCASPGRREFAPKPFVPIRYDPDDQAPFSPRSALCGGLGVCPGPQKCYEKINDDRATHKEGVRATYRCAEGPPGGKWNLAADTPPSKRVGRRRASKRAREELAMLQREARPKQKPVNTL